jgi:acylphosphatase
MVAKQLLIRGQVQGVGYRDWMQRQASRLGILGWVRNRGRDTVEAWVEGPMPEVEELMRLCRRGPPLARVSDITEELAEARSDPNLGFQRLPSV